MKHYLASLVRRRDLIVYLATSGLKAQHKNSFLGYFWWLLDPFLNVLIYYFVVVTIFRNPGGASYGMYLICGMIVWRWHAATISSATRSITTQSRIISQVYLPKAVFPISAAFVHIINFGFGLVVAFIFFIFLGFRPGMNLLWLPLIMGVQLLFLLAISFPFSFFSVFVRDVNNLVTHGMQLWFFSTPVVWKPKMLPEKGRWLLEFNPMYHIISSYRDAIIYNARPNLVMLMLISLISFGVVGFMVWFFKAKEHLILKSL